MRRPASSRIARSYQFHHTIWPSCNLSTVLHITSSGSLCLPMIWLPAPCTCNSSIYSWYKMMLLPYLVLEDVIVAGNQASAAQVLLQKPSETWKGLEQIIDASIYCFVATWPTASYAFTSSLTANDAGLCSSVLKCWLWRLFMPFRPHASFACTLQTLGFTGTHPYSLHPVHFLPWPAIFFAHLSTQLCFASTLATPYASQQ